MVGYLEGSDQLPLPVLHSNSGNAAYLLGNGKVTKVLITQNMHVTHKTRPHDPYIVHVLYSCNALYKCIVSDSRVTVL